MPMTSSSPATTVAAGTDRDELHRLIPRSIVVRDAVALEDVIVAGRNQVALDFRLDSFLGEPHAHRR
jgi:hypothetical protein